MRRMVSNRDVRYVSRTAIDGVGHGRCAHRVDLVCRVVQPAFESAANGFLAEYDLAGIKIAPLARQQLHAGYVAELQRASDEVGGSTGALGGLGPAVGGLATAKDLPPLRSGRRGVPRLTLLWDIESIKPFTQQHGAHHLKAENLGSSGSTGGSSGSGGDDGSGGSAAKRQAASSSGSRASRMATAGLAGANSPDLLGALDQLCRTLQEYGVVHAVHLFLRESSLHKAPVLRRQVEELVTWVEPQHGGGAAGNAGLPGEAGRVPAAVLAAPAAAHECPMCRSAHPTRLALLRHFTTVHQAPLLAATAANARTHIMWTRGRAVPIPIPVPVTASPEPSGYSGPVLASAHDLVMADPQEFVYARELLIRGRHLDDLLAAAPPSVTTVADSGGGSPQGAKRGTKEGAGNPGHAGKGGHSSSRSSLAASGAAGGSDVALGPGLHLHMVPAGQPVEAVAAELVRAAGQLVAKQTHAAATAGDTGGPTLGRLAVKGGRTAQGGQGRAGGRMGSREAEEAAPPCLCVVSDMEGLDQFLGELQRQGMPVIAVSRTTKVSSVEVALRWWAVQAGEYRLQNAR